MPTKTRTASRTDGLLDRYMDPTAWHRFPSRPDDIIVATYAKSGTTWTQQIVTQLVHDGDPSVSAAGLSPWLDLRIPAEAETFAGLAAQPHRRVIKTHLPADLMTFRPGNRVIYIARDGRDVAWSLHNHYANLLPAVFDMLNATPADPSAPAERGAADPVAFFRDWLARDGYPVWSFWDSVRSWWAVRDRPDVLLLHYNDLKADLPFQILRIADFLGIEVRPESFPQIVEHCSFDWMKAHAGQVAPLGGAIWEGGGETFIHRGTNGRWRDLLAPADIARYEARALAELGPDCAAWLAAGAAGLARWRAA